MRKQCLALCLTLLFSASCPAFSATADLLTRVTQARPPAERTTALEELPKLDAVSRKKLVAGLLHSINDTDAQVRQNAAEALGTLDQQAIESAPELVRLKNDPVKAVARMAAMSLARMGFDGQTIIEELISELRLPQSIPVATSSESKVQRARAAGALGFIGAGTKHTNLGAAIPALNRALIDDFDTDVKIKVAWALGAIGKEAKEALPALRAAMHNQKVSYTAYWAIKQIIKKDPAG